MFAIRKIEQPHETGTKRYAMLYLISMSPKTRRGRPFGFLVEKYLRRFHFQ